MLLLRLFQILRFLLIQFVSFSEIVGILAALPLVNFLLPSIAEHLHTALMAQTTTQSSLQHFCFGTSGRMSVTLVIDLRFVVHHCRVRCCSQRPDEVEGVRYGEEVLNSGHSSEDCEVSYVTYDTTGISQELSLKGCCRGYQSQQQKKRADWG